MIISSEIATGSGMTRCYCYSNLLIAYLSLHQLKPCKQYRELGEEHHNRHLLTL